MLDDYVLILVSLNPDSTDLSNIIFPESGHVEAKHYKPDKNIRNGLYGILWGISQTSKWMNLDPKAIWKVVRTEQNSEIIPLDSDGFVKFRHGMVVFSGSREKCADYLKSFAPKEEHCSLAAIKNISIEKTRSRYPTESESNKPTSFLIFIFGYILS